MRGKRWIGAVLGAAFLAGPAAAHPHVWIDTRVEVLLDDQDRAVAVRIDWTYDDLYSLYIIGDRGLDPDWDGKLTPEEEAKLSGFDMNWDAGFPGDTYVLIGETEVALSRPTDWGARYEGNRITSTHLRTFAAPVEIGAGTLFVQTYDPGFYTAYTIAFDPVLTGGSGRCIAEAWEPDLDAADQALKDALAEYGADYDLEMDFPAIGKAYAEEVRVTCAAP